MLAAPSGGSTPRTPAHTAAISPATSPFAAAPISTASGSTAAAGSSTALPLRYGCRVLLYRQSMEGYVVSTNSAEAPVGLQRYDPQALGEQRLHFERAVFVVSPGDAVDASAGGRRDGDVVKYGQVVRLTHLSHQQPLCVRTEQHAVGRKGNLRVVLGGGGDARGRASRGSAPPPAGARVQPRCCRWRVMPRYRLRVEGEAVASGDPVLLQMPTSTLYLNSADEYDEVSNGCCLEVSCGTAVQGFQALLYDNDVGRSFRPAVLRCGDCVTLLHTEEHKYLTADSEKGVCYLRSPESKLTELGEEAELAPSLATSLFPRLVAGSVAASGATTESAGAVSGPGGLGGETASTDSQPTAVHGGPATEEVSYLSTFFVESVNPRRGGALRSGGAEYYRLKCLSSGLYLQTGCVAVNPADVEYQDAESDAGSCGGGGGASSNDAKSVLSLNSPTSVSGSSFAFEFPSHVTYELALTSDPLASGTVFRILLASPGSVEHISSGNRVFLEAVNTPNGSVWLSAGGRLNSGDVESEVTVASLMHPSTTTGSVALYAKSIKSMRDGLELRRLPTRAARELHMIRSLLPPLERYAVNMLDGTGDPFRVREVRENIAHLQQLCYSRSGPSLAARRAGLLGTTTATATGEGADPGGGTGAGVSGEARASGAAQDSEDDDDADADLMDARNRVEGVLSAAWQSKMVQQGVPSLVLRVAEATVHCPYVRPALLHTADVVQPDDPLAVAALEERQRRHPVRETRAGKFVPMRYSELGALMDACFDFVALLVSERPKYAQSLHSHVDFLTQCCVHTPSALRCLAVVFQRNPVFVELPMARDRLQFFLDLLSARRRDPWVFRVVQLFARCGEESMVEAQRVILNYLTTGDVAEQLLCPLKWAPPPLSGVADGPAADDPLVRDASAALETLSDAGTNPLTLPANPTKRRSVAIPTAVPGTVVPSSPRAQTGPRLPSRAANGDVVTIGIPHEIFAEEQSGDSLSIATSTQLRGKDSALGRLLLDASNAEDVSGKTAFPIEALNASLQDWSELKDIFIPLYTEQLLLFASLAAGRNQHASRSLVHKWVPPDILAAMLESEALPVSVHAAFVTLFADVTVDVSGSVNLTQDLRRLRCVVTGEKTDESAVSTYTFRAAKPVPSSDDALHYAMRYLARTAVSGDEEVGVEFLSTLRLTEALVNSGAVALERYPELIACLVNCLDPRSDDRATPLEAPIVHHCKCTALRLLNSVMDIMLTRKALELVDSFSANSEAPAASQLFQFTFDDFLQRGRLPPGGAPPEQPTIVAEGLGAEERKTEKPLVLVGSLCTTLMELAFTTESVRVRRQCVFLFLRVTNYLEELYGAASRVQLLTSSASVAFYADINRTSTAAELLLRKSFRRSNTLVLAHDILDALDGFLAEPDYGAAIEKLAMMHHVGVPQQLLAMLQRLPLPIRESGHRIIFKAVSLLQSMAQYEHIKVDLRREVEALAPLTAQDANMITLLRSLYIRGASERRLVPYGVVSGVARCLSLPQSASAAIDFLADLLSVSGPSGHPIAQHQQHVWRAIVTDTEIVRQVQFRRSWCGERGHRIRQRVLASRDYYVSTGRLSRHLGLCHLLYLISVENDVVRPEEVRHEVFGLNSLDSMLEVLTDPQLPAFFRKAYGALAETLILSDPAALTAVYAHRSFGEFLRICTMDCTRYLQQLGGASVFPEVDEELERREDAALRCAPTNAFEQMVDDSRFGSGVYAGLVFGPVCGCLRRVCASYQAGVARVSNRLRSQLKLCINECIDVLCDLVQHALRAGADPWTGAQSLRLADALRAAKVEGFHGTGRWRGEPFETLFLRLDGHTRGSQTPVEAAPTSPILGLVDADGDTATAEREMTETRLLQSPTSPASAACTPAAGPSLVKAGDAYQDPAVPVTAIVEGASVRSGESLKPLERRQETATGRRGDAGTDEAGNGSVAAEAGEGKAVTSRWAAFLQTNVLDSPYLAPGNVYLSAAGVVLRSGDRGTAFLRMLFGELTSMSGANATRLLCLIRQIARLAPNNPLDDSILLPLERVTTETPCLTMELSQTARQSLLARWAGDSSLENPVPLLALVLELAGSSYPGLRLAALETATTLLKGGHRGMQESYNSYCKRTSNERLFLVLRNHLSNFLDELRRFQQGMLRGSTPTEAAHYLASLHITTLELKLIQLFCANQFNALQTYLAAQPDNDVSVNLVESMVELLSMSPTVANEVTTAFFLQLLHTVSETLQGPCRGNQDSFVAYKAADYLTLLLSDQNMLLFVTGGLSSAEEEAHRARSRRERRAERRAVAKVAARRAERASFSQGNGATTVAAAVAVVGGRGEDAGAPSVEEVRRQCVRRIHAAALSTLLALIEGRQEPDFIGRVLLTVDLAVLGKSMDSSVCAYEARYGSVERVHSKGVLNGDFRGSFRALRRYLRDTFVGDIPTDREELEDELALAVSIYIFFRACYDMQVLAVTRSLRRGEGKARLITQSFSEFLDKRGRSISQVLGKTKSYRRMGKRVAKVEIIRDGTLERVYFRVLASSEDNLYRETRRRVILNAVRTSDNERIQNFFDQCLECIVEINTLAALRRRVLVYLLNYCSRELSLLALLLILALNLVMVIGVRAPTSPYEPGTSPEIDRALKGLGIAIICVQGVLVLQALTGPVAVQRAADWSRFASQREARVALAARHDMAADRSKLLSEDDRQNRKRALGKKIVVGFLSVVTNIVFLEHAFFLFVCIMGFVQHPIWYSVQLLQIMFNSPILQNLVTALSRNVMSLVLTLVLWLFVIFIFTTVSFYFFAELFDPFGTRGNGFNCYTLSQCWLVHLDVMRNGGGVGDVADWPVYYSKDGFGYWFSFFRLAYFLCVNLILANLFLGIIVDSLAQLRQWNNFVKTDQQSKCFLCGVARNVFDVVQPGTYDTHIAEEQNMWHYVYFLHYLSAKPTDSLTGQEAYVSRLVRMRDVTFFPIGQSVVLSCVPSGRPDAAASPEDAASPGGGSPSAGRLGDMLATALSANSDVLETAVRKATDPLRKQLEEAHQLLEKLVGVLNATQSPTQAQPVSPTLEDGDARERAGFNGSATQAPL